jgi:hypothetical protein
MPWERSHIHGRGDGMQGRLARADGRDSLIADEAAERHTAPAHATHEATGEALSPSPVDVVSVLVVRGDGARASAHE